MKFGPIPVGEAAGAISAHALRVGDAALRKGARITADDAAALAAAGLERIVAAVFEPGDLGEDEAAARLAEAVAGDAVQVERPFTGRANLHAAQAGILRVERAVVDGVNAVDEAVTLATLPAFRAVAAGEMVGTVKIIPYAVAGATLDRALAAARPALAVAPYRVERVGVVSTLTPGFKPTIVAKTLRVLGNRLAPAGAAITRDVTCAHDAGALSAALAELAASDVELVVVFGASAIADRRDVIPAAIEAAGGAVEHLGMPVDPGNLLLVGALEGRPVIGAPGCARSPKENGFDWVLGRLLAGLAVTRADIVGMGVGGLLMEIPVRGQPRSGGAGEEP